MLPQMRWPIVDSSCKKSPGKICTGTFGIKMQGWSKRNELGSASMTEGKISTSVYNLMNNSRNL